MGTSSETCSGGKEFDRACGGPDKAETVTIGDTASGVGGEVERSNAASGTAG